MALPNFHLNFATIHKLSGNHSYFVTLGVPNYCSPKKQASVIETGQFSIRAFLNLSTEYEDTKGLLEDHRNVNIRNALIHCLEEDEYKREERLMRFAA